MSSLTSVIPPAVAPASGQSVRLLSPKTQAIPLLAVSHAKAYSTAHTVGILLYYYLRSGALVQAPLTILLQDLVPVAVLQAFFCATCLPAAGDWYSGTGEMGRGSKIIEGTARSGKSKHSSASLSTAQHAGSLRRRVGASGNTPKTPIASRSSTADGIPHGGSLRSRILPSVLSLILTFTVPPVPLAVLALVLGAPLYPTSLLPLTFTLAIHIAILAFFPLFYTHGVSGAAWRDLAAAWLPFDEAGVWGGTVGTMVGGWIGAIPMALDWDREWQKWPCTVLWGAVLGWGVGRVITGNLRLGIGKRIDLSEGRHVEHTLATVDDGAAKKSQ